MTPQTETAATRPRVEGVREVEILDAALDVLADVGYDRLTMDAVALRAKASKATLYRRWNGKASLVIDALTTPPARGLGCPVDTGSLRGRPASSPSAASGGLTDKPEVGRVRQRSSPRSAGTPSSPTRSAATSSAPKLAASQADLRAGQASAARSAPTPTSTCSRRRSPGSSCTACSSSARPPPRTSSPASSTRSSCPAATRRRPTALPPTQRRITNDRHHRLRAPSTTETAAQTG